MGNFFAVISAFGFRNESILRRKMIFFKNSCLMECDKILNLMTLKIGLPIYNPGYPADFRGKLSTFLLTVVNDMFGYFVT